MIFKIFFRKRFVARKHNKKTRGRTQYLKYKKQARIIVEEKIIKFNKFYNFKIKRIAIRDQKTRWGSCSTKGNLNFNYKIALIPEYLAEYIVVHELCHLQEFNHSKNFWDLVAQTYPDYSKARKELKRISLSLK